MEHIVLKQKKICVITATRAEYFLLSPLMRAIESHTAFQLQIVATGMHLSPEFGMTYQDIEKDGFVIDRKVEMLLSSDTPEGIAKSMGLAMLSFPAVFAELQPDMIILLGDRYEMIPIASVANIYQIPLAHIHGGEKTEGAMDESFRHCLTKLSYLHFTATEEYRNRVIQLGEQPERVFQVGALAVENIKNTSLLSKQALEESISFSLGEQFILFTFHPVTLEQNTAEEQFAQVLQALDSFPDYQVIFTKANADTDGRIINQMIDQAVTQQPQRYVAFTSLGMLRYLSAMKYCTFVMGNSSSGILEAPVFRKPTINIGDRQKGRYQAQSVIDCLPEKESILQAVQKAESETFLQGIESMENPFGDGTTSQQIIEVLETFLWKQDLDLKKVFYDVDCS